MILVKYSKDNLNLLKELSYNRFKLNDANTFLGFFWSFLNPLLLLSVLYLIFNIKFGNSVENYGIYLLIGIVHYNHFSSTTSSSMRVLRSMRALTSNTIFPKEILVYSSIFSNLITFLISVFICIIFALVTGLHLSSSYIMLPVIIVMQLLLVIWISLILSCVFVIVRDIEHIYQVFLRVLFFACPIFYDISILGDGLGKKIAQLNPLTHLMTFTRAVLLEGQFISLYAIGMFCIINLCLIIISLIIFKRLEAKFVEYL